MTRTDLAHFRRWFKGYVAGFYSGSPDDQQPIFLKEQHTERTCKEILRLGREIGVAEEDLLLAETTALFHDIGRFKQWKDYRTFIDSGSRNHALLALELISRKEILAPIPPGEQDLIRESIRLHNLKKLPDGLPPRHFFFARLLRDADKLDIWEMIIIQQREQSSLMDTLAGNIPSSSSYSRRILAELMQGRIPDFRWVQNRNDVKLVRMGWVFDLNFVPACRQVLQRRYIEQLYSQLPTDREIGELKKYLISYLENRIHTNC